MGCGGYGRYGRRGWLGGMVLFLEGSFWTLHVDPLLSLVLGIVLGVGPARVQVQAVHAHRAEGAVRRGGAAEGRRAAPRPPLCEVTCRTPTCLLLKVGAGSPLNDLASWGPVPSKSPVPSP